MILPLWLRFAALNSALLLGICFGTATAGEAAADGNSYRVGEETKLTEVAVRLYGDPKMWRKIARWNHLRRPYYVWRGRELRLEEPPTLDAKQGDEALLQYWRKHFGLEGEIPAPAATANIAPSPAPTPSGAPKGRLEEAEAIAPGKSRARDLLADGQKLFHKKKYGGALDKFVASRQIDPDFLPAWFYEIRTLKLLKHDAEAQKRSDELLARKPALKALPMFQPGYQEPAE